MRLRALLLLLVSALGAQAEDEFPSVDGLDGRGLMEATYARHRQFPFVYEEQALVLTDARGARTARRLKRYSRVEPDGTARLMLLFTSPPELNGVALLAVRRPGGALAEDERRGSVAMYLPALGPRLVQSESTGRDAGFLGTDFTIENLVGEELDDYRYVRRRSRNVDGVPRHVVDAFDLRDDPRTARPIRRHYVRADNLFIDRTDHYDELGRVARRQTTHGLRPVDGALWRGDMILMEDSSTEHSSLLKIERRVFSRDYVPRELFALDWLVRNRPPREARAEPEEGPLPEEIVLPERVVRVERKP